MKNNIDRRRKYLYGMDAARYQELLVQQEGRCAICRKGETRLGVRGTVRGLSVDHCHTTGKVRGLLCSNCNSALGHAGDDPNMLRRMASYLEVNKGTDVLQKMLSVEVLNAEFDNLFN